MAHQHTHGGEGYQKGRRKEESQTEETVTKIFKKLTINIKLHMKVLKTIKWENAENDKLSKYFKSNREKS
jgi:hypothetical protein